MASAKNDKKVFDVSKPKDVKAAATSKPVISHRPILKDPMVSKKVNVASDDDEDTKTKPAANGILTPAGRKRIAPSAETVEHIGKRTNEATATSIAIKSAMPADEPEPPSPQFEEAPAEEPDALPIKDLNDAPAEEPAALEPGTTPAEEPAAEPESAEPESPEPDEKPEPAEETLEPEEDKAADVPDNSPGNAAVNSVLGNAQDSNNAEAALAEREAKIQELAESNKYKVEIGAARKHKGSGGKIGWIILILLLLGLAGAYAAVDDGLIKTNITLPYHFFKQKQAASQNSTPTVVTKKTVTTVPTSALPAGWATYENKDLGFMFNYLKKWGTPEVRDLSVTTAGYTPPVPATLTGKRYIVDFGTGGASAPTMWLKTKDWVKKGNTPADQICGPIGFTSYDTTGVDTSLKVEDPAAPIVFTNTKEFDRLLLLQPDRYLVQKVYAYDVVNNKPDLPCGMVIQVNGKVKFYKSADFAGADVTYEQGTFSKTSFTLDDFKKNAATLLPTQLVKDITTFTKSIQETN